MRVTVPLSEFHTPEAASMLPPIDLIRPVQEELLVVARGVAKDGEQVTPSRLSSLGGDVGEGGVYLQQGARNGAVAHARWVKREPDEIEIKIRPLSKTQVVLIWTTYSSRLIQPL